VLHVFSKQFLKFSVSIRPTHSVASFSVHLLYVRPLPQLFFIVLFNTDVESCSVVLLWPFCCSLLFWVTYTGYTLLVIVGCVHLHRVLMLTENYWSLSYVMYSYSCVLLMFFLKYIFSIYYMGLCSCEQHCSVPGMDCVLCIVRWSRCEYMKNFSQ
jgi:hypothetical protein